MLFLYHFNHLLDLKEQSIEDQHQKRSKMPRYVQVLQTFWFLFSSNSRLKLTIQQISNHSLLICKLKLFCSYLSVKYRKIIDSLGLFTFWNNFCNHQDQGLLSLRFNNWICRTKQSTWIRNKNEVPYSLYINKVYFRAILWFNKLYEILQAHSFMTLFIYLKYIVIFIKNNPSLAIF